MRLVLIATLFISVCRPASAGSIEKDLPPMLELFEAPCRELEIPCPVTMAIAKVESGFHPWSLNIEGRGFKFKTKNDALTKARQALSAGRSFDVGLMQVNSWWLKRYEIPLEAALDPLANIYLGGWILKTEIARHKNLRAAVGAYHSPKPDKARRYADVVMAALERGPVMPSSKKAAKPKAMAPSTRKASAMPILSGNRPMAVKKNQSSPMNVYNSNSSMKVRSRSK